MDDTNQAGSLEHGARLPNDEPILITQDELADDSAETRVDFERGMSHAPSVTMALISANVAVFAWEWFGGALANQQALIAAGALNRAEVEHGQFWRLATSIFLHADPSHLVGNCVVLYIVGMACEHAYGKSRTLAAYLFSGLAGSCLSVLLEAGPCVGASGAIFGLLGCVVVFLRRYRHEFYVRDAQIGVVLAVWALYQLASGFFDPRTANMAHLGGLIVGSSAPMILRPRLLGTSPSIILV
ncbi:MAG TPA: rhomboid family intramembrane serine protease [Pirellulales bacterium]|nr:rhomboid family intramembrane serine protease [Pirellulales bacterium]